MVRSARRNKNLVYDHRSRHKDPPARTISLDIFRHSTLPHSRNGTAVKRARCTQCVSFIPCQFPSLIGTAIGVFTRSTATHMQYPAASHIGSYGLDVASQGTIVPSGDSSHALWTAARQEMFVSSINDTQRPGTQAR